MPELANDSRFRTNADRVKFRSVLIPLLKQVFQQETLENWEAKFKKCAFPHGPINNFQKTFAHEQTVHNNVVINLPHSAAPDGVKLAGPRKFIRLSLNFPQISENFPDSVNFMLAS